MLLPDGTPYPKFKFHILDQTTNTQNVVTWSKCSSANGPSTCLTITENDKPLYIGYMKVVFGWLSKNGISSCLGSASREQSVTNDASFYWGDIRTEFFIDSELKANYMIDSSKFSFTKNKKVIKLNSYNYIINAIIPF